MITIQSFLFQSIPEGIVYSMFVIALAGLRIRPNLLKVFLSGVVIACITVVLWFLDLLFIFRFLLQVPLFWLVVYFIFYIPFNRVMVIATIGLGTLVIIETLCLEFVLQFTQYTYEELLASASSRIMIPSIGYLFLILITLFINRKGWSLFSKLDNVNIGDSAVNKNVSLYILALTGQILLVVIYNLSYVNGLFQQSDLMIQILSLTVIILSLLLLFFVQYIISLAEKAGELEAQKGYIKHVNDLFITIRGQRHDFVNHIQVIRSFTQMKKYDLLESYINDLTTEVKEITKIMIPDNATLSALLQTKSVLFDTFDIALDITMEVNINKAKMDAIDQVKLIGNLLDNAKEAICEHDVPKDRRKISLSIVPQEDTIVIKVMNELPVIPPDKLEQIFNAGYTSKANHTGIGLAIVKQIVSRYNGNIFVVSDEKQGTVFTITIPIPKDEQVDSIDSEENS